jgi:hypothetical protein
MADNQEGDASKRKVWDRWISEYMDLSNPVPLFETDSEGVVQIKQHGRDSRPILKRSRQMESLLSTEGRKVVDDWQGSDDTYEGVIYIMYTLDRDELVPLYVGKAGKYGRDGERLSANLKNIRTNRNKFARWGDGYAYHLGELSAVVLDHQGDPEVNRSRDPKRKYQSWADAMFIEGTRQLKQPVYLWARAWRYDDTGPFYGFETSLEALEYNLINLGSDLYPEKVLNSEGA